MNIRGLSPRLTIVFVVLLHTLIWFVAFLILSFNDPFGLYTSFPDFLFRRSGEFFSTLLMLVLTLNLLLSSRFKFLEKLTMGLDKSYLIHKYLGYFSFLLLILHFLLIRETNIIPSGFFFLAKDINMPIFYIFLAGIFISALPHIPILKKIFNIPYHIWKQTHLIMGFVFIAGVYHSLGVTTFTFNNNILSVYMYMVYAIGAFSFIYKLGFYNIFVKKHEYFVDNLIIRNETNIDIILKPKNEKIFWKAGQFAFFKFLVKNMKESHPFTIASSRENGEIRLAIKTLGDYTSQIRKKLKVGGEVLIDGPYGKFVSAKENNNQEIWIAGGIGVTPYLAMLEDYKKNNNPNKDIILVWSVQEEGQLIYKNEIEKDLPANFHFIPHDVSRLGFFKFESLKNRIKDINLVEVFVCGPEVFKNSVLDSVREMGIKSFNYEEFNFR